MPTLLSPADARACRDNILEACAKPAIQQNVKFMYLLKYAKIAEGGITPLSTDFWGIDVPGQLSPGLYGLQAPVFL